MAQRRHHYERAFERYLRAARIPYVAVNEARKALLPSNARLELLHPDGTAARTLKSFDFVIYGEGGNLLIEIKGRKIRVPTRRLRQDGRPTRGRMESWVTTDDIDSLTTWRGLFGPEFEAVFVFVYWCDHEPPDGLFQEVFEHDGRWYVVRAVELDAYTSAMQVRSPKWGTVHLKAEAFDRLSRPLTTPGSVTAESFRQRLDAGPLPPVLEQLGGSVPESP